MTRIYLLAAALLTMGQAASAQPLSAFREQLAIPLPGSAAEATVTVNEQDDAAQAVAQAARENTRLRFRGYRVCIYFDNGQDARAGAEAARRLFADTYPATPVYIAYNSPYFTVTAGNCVTAEEAILLMGRVKDTFPKAFLKTEELTLSDLVEQ